MKFEFEYGQGTMAANLPDNTDVFIPGETVKDPACIPEDQLEAAYLESLAHPIGMPTLTELAHKGSTVTIIVPDRVKGGEQPTSHRKLSIKYILRELSSSSSPTDFIQEAKSPMQRQFLAMSYSTSSGIPVRSSATTVRTRSTWYTSEPLTEVTRYT